MKLTQNEEILLKSLRDNAENPGFREGFWSVYLDNAGGSFSPRSFAGILGSLQKKGLYYPQDGEFFGEVKIDDQPL